MVSKYPMAAWQVPGIVTDRRELGKKADKNDIWAYSITVTCFGGAYEMQTREKRVYEASYIGAEVESSGTFELFQGQIRLALKTLNVVQETPVAGQLGRPGAAPVGKVG